MGEAEDVVFRRERSQKEAQERQEAAELIDKIRVLMPSAIDNLRHHDYVFASQCHEVITFDGEDRVGWSAHNGQYGDNPCGHHIFILGDGTIVHHHSRSSTLEVDLNDLSLQCIKEVWQTVWAMKNHKKR